MSEHSIRTAKTDSGVPVVVEHIPGCGSYACMIAVATGSRDESEDIFGISHLLEHTVFRRTSTRDSYQMAVEMEGAGGEMNAFTGREMTAFYGTTIKETDDVARSIIGDIVTDPVISPEDTELEKKIVLQELSMIKNEPDSYIHDLFGITLWRGHELSQDEGGDEKLVARMTSDDLRGYYADRYVLPNFCVYAAGDADLDGTVAWAEDALKDMPDGRRNVRTAPPMPRSEYRFVENKAEHYHVAMGFPGIGVDAKSKVSLAMLRAILGSGTSSRLFQEVREKKALVYSIYTTVSQHSDACSMVTYMSCTEDNVVEAMTTTSAEFGRILDGGLGKGELDRAKRLIKGAYIRGMESTEQRLYRLSVNHMLNGTTYSLDDYLRKIDEVTDEDVVSMAERIIRNDTLNTVVLGEKSSALKKFDAGDLSFRTASQEYDPAFLRNVGSADLQPARFHYADDVRIVPHLGTVLLAGRGHDALVAGIDLHLRAYDQDPSG